MTDHAPGHPEILRIVAPNPGPMTLEGTNTFVVEEGGRAYVIDPGPADEGHLARIREAADALGGIAGVLLTHSHGDHAEGAPASASRSCGRPRRQTIKGSDPLGRS